MPNFGMNRPTSDSGIYPVSHNSPASVILAIFLVIVLSGIFYLATESSNGNGLTEAEVAHINSVESVVTTAPQTSVIKYKDGKLDIIEYANRDIVALQGSKSNPNRKIRITDDFITKIDRVVDPTDKDHPEFLALAHFCYAYDCGDPDTEIPETYQQLIADMK